ncbi:MAG: hypothetical protein ISS47_01430 [Candidatus Omnitrophica bacterium]|nr:hypothetical protein [Candidatus Omnitrophota bacterium]
MIKILFLVETGHGMGHITRCLNLAKAFEKKSHATFSFLTRGNKGTEKIGYDKEDVTQDFLKKIEDKLREFNPDIFIMDILNIDPEILEILAKKSVIAVTTFDFLINKDISSDIIVNPNLAMMNYRSSDSECLLGPKYTIIGDYFRDKKKEIRKKVNFVMISMGGSDPKDYTSKAIEALRDFNLNVDVVVGTLSKNKEKVEKKISQLGNFNFKSNVTNGHMCRLMLKNDVLFSTAGNTMYEAASLGLPNIVFCNHQRHDEIATSFKNRGVVINLGIEPEINTIKNAVNSLINDFSRRKKMSYLGTQLIDAKGAERTAEIILERYNFYKGKDKKGESI